MVSDKEVALAQAKLAKAEAQVQLAQTELNFTDIKAPFDGIIDRLHEQQGSLIEEGDMLTSLSDNGVMWVYFNVPEARYLEYKADLDSKRPRTERRGRGHANRTRAGERQQVRAARQDRRDRGRVQQRNREHRLPRGFPNPDGLLRHGQTGTC